MGQKVWVIDDQSWQSPSRRPADTDGRPPKTIPKNNIARPVPQRQQKNPALAFTLSMVAWGIGHLYSGQYRSGLRYLAAMAAFYAAAVCVVVFRDDVSTFLSETFIPVSLLITSFIIFLVSGLAVWLFNAVDAYFAAAGANPFQGVGNSLCPLLGSLLFPGWGQFLNGQPRKGIFFLLFGSTGLFAVALWSAALNIWPVLNTGTDRFFLETYLAASLLLFPLSLLMWIVSAHDSIRSSRSRRHGPVQGLGAQLRATAMLGLLLAVLYLGGMRYVPENYYVNFLERIRISMLNSDMHMAPELVGRVIDLLALVPG